MGLLDIKGVGEKTAAALNKLNIFDEADLLNYFPRNYMIYEEPMSFMDIDNRVVAPIKAVLISLSNPVHVKKLVIVRGVIKDEAGVTLNVTWFNMPYINKMISVGKVYVFYGRINKEKKTMEVPICYTMESYKEKLGNMQPVYKLSAGVTNNLVSKVVSECLTMLNSGEIGMGKELLDKDFYLKNHLMERKGAYNKIHFPKNKKEYEDAKRRFAFDEFLEFCLKINALKDKPKSVNNNYICRMNERTKEFINSLSFKLTNAQTKVVDEIVSDMSSQNRMNRLIQGDVGSGKTIVAIISLMNACFCGFQGALMAPTEVLANQHYESIIKLFKEHNIDLKVALLTGSFTAKKKKEIYDLIKKGEIDILIGTHALIQEKIEYKNLALVITDEQHRFGVKQREALYEKGDLPHVLVMSATPIPRTLAIILYGDLDISVIDELPANRLPIKNAVCDESFRPKAYSFIRQEVRKGHQAYIICPMVSENEMYEACDVLSYSQTLQNIFGDEIKVEFLHGKMKPREKDEVMKRFATNETNVLVSTTVVEVGVNVPNATVMMVENAERFGLASLHQLRGRVGRGNAQSYCMFICTTKSESAKEKLKILEKSNDGFFVASEDLKLRGSGDLLGVRQSGEMSFKIGNIFTDTDLLKLASETAKKYNNDSVVSDTEIIL